jgi:hypothetical protein
MQYIATTLTEVLKVLYEYNESGRLEIKGSEDVEKV